MISDLSGRNTKEILQLAETQKPVMFEKDFVTTWLLTLREFCAGGEVAIGLWLQSQKTASGEDLTITPFQEVDIRDYSGNVLFTVPSIFAPADNIMDDVTKSIIPDVFDTAYNIEKSIPGSGTKLVEREIVSHITPSDKIDSHRKRWDDIFIRYRLEPVFDLSRISEVTKSPNPFDEEHGDFDEFEEI